MVEIVKLSNQFDVALVGRGAGTGLSGGALARRGGIVVAFSRMNHILEIDAANKRAVVEPGVVNLDLTRAAEKHGLYFSPDPSSQKACTIGGNVAENSGGPHTLANGVTANHVTGLEIVLPDGNAVHLGGKTVETPGYDLTGLFVGSEGTFALVTEITVKLMRLPEEVRTLLAVFETVEDATESVVEITARGMTPAACEMLDGWTLRAVEEFVHAGFPLDSAAVLLLEVEGVREAAEAQAAAIAEVCTLHHAREVRRARDDAERELLWKGRKNAFGAVGRLSPSYYVLDGVIPRTKLTVTLQHIAQIGKRHGFQIGNIFHAGDGNLHPLILFDQRDPAQFERALAAATEIIRFCVEMGGALTGEHGVGMEKNELMPLMFNDADLNLMREVRAAFNPTGRLNPDKIFPLGKGCGETRLNPMPVAGSGIGMRGRQLSVTKATEEGKAVMSELKLRSPTDEPANGIDPFPTGRFGGRGACGQRRGRRLGAYAVDGLMPQAALRPESAAEVAAILRFASAERLAVIPMGGRSKLGIGMPPRKYDLALDMTRMNRVLAYDPGDLTLGVEPGVRYADLARQLAGERQFLPLAPAFAERATIGGIVAAGADSPLRYGYGSVRDFLLGMEFVTGAGVASKSGGRVVKNVTGYDLHKLLVGSLGTLAVITRINFRTFPVPPEQQLFIVSYKHARAALGLCERVAKSQLQPRMVEAFNQETATRFGIGAAGNVAGDAWRVAIAAAGETAAVARHARELAAMARETAAAGFDTLDDAQGAALVAGASASLRG